jgi:hypothetical protein
LQPQNKEGLTLNITDAGHEYQRPNTEAFTLQIDESVPGQSNTNPQGLTLNIKDPHNEEMITATTGKDRDDQKLELLTLCWSAKEAIYKWYGNGGVDFKKHIQLKQPLDYSKQQWIESIFVFDREAAVSLNLYSRFFNELVLTYVVSS